LSVFLRYRMQIRVMGSPYHLSKELNLFCEKGLLCLYVQRDGGRVGLQRQASEHDTILAQVRVLPHFLLY
jgi:hypothetical protein